MCVQAAKNRSSYQLFPLLQSDMSVIDQILLTKPKINNKYLIVGSFQHEVSRLDITIQISLVMEAFDNFERFPHDEEKHIFGDEVVLEVIGRTFL